MDESVQDWGALVVRALSEEMRMCTRGRGSGRERGSSAVVVGLLFCVIVFVLFGWPVVLAYVFWVPGPVAPFGGRVSCRAGGALFCYIRVPSGPR
jgi:hypothetical protein